MTEREKIALEIRELCERAMQLAPSRIEHDENAAEQKINHIIASAKTAVKHSYRVYENFRREISDAAANSRQYDNAIRQLTAVLGV